MHILYLAIIKKYIYLPCKQDFITNVNVQKEAEGVQGKIPTHPPLHCDEEEFEGFGIWKEELKLWKKLPKSALSHFRVYLK